MTDEKIQYVDSSLTYWFGRVDKIVVIPTPKTIWVNVNGEILFNNMEERTMPRDYVNAFKEAGRKIGYPLFVRTDNFSSKHSWKDTCYVESEEKLITHIQQIIENNFAGFMMPDINAIVFREFIPMESSFTAFHGDMPISKERRYFINNGKVECHHPYWPEDSIRHPSKRNWRSMLKKLNKESPAEIHLLSDYARLVARSLDGFWSVDFCKAKDGRWILIDMAAGELSFHPYQCRILQRKHPKYAAEMKRCYGPKKKTKSAIDWIKNLPEGAEVKEEDGLVSLTAPIKDTDFTTENEKRRRGAISPL